MIKTGIEIYKPVGIISFSADVNKMDVSVVETVPHIGRASALLIWHIETSVINSEIVSIKITSNLSTIFFVIPFLKGLAKEGEGEMSNNKYLVMSCMVLLSSLIDFARRRDPSCIRTTWWIFHFRSQNHQDDR